MIEIALLVAGCSLVAFGLGIAVGAWHERQAAARIQPLPVDRSLEGAARRAH